MFNYLKKKADLQVDDWTAWHPNRPGKDPYQRQSRRPGSNDGENGIILTKPFDQDDSHGIVHDRGDLYPKHFSNRTFGDENPNHNHDIPNDYDTLMDKPISNDNADAFIDDNSILLDKNRSEEDLRRDSGSLSQRLNKSNSLFDRIVRHQNR